MEPRPRRLRQPHQPPPCLHRCSWSASARRSCGRWSSWTTHRLPPKQMRRLSFQRFPPPSLMVMLMPPPSTMTIPPPLLTMQMRVSSLLPQEWSSRAAMSRAKSPSKRPMTTLRPWRLQPNPSAMSPRLLRRSRTVQACRLVPLLVPRRRPRRSRWTE
jgi:hypothetical protein